MSGSVFDAEERVEGESGKKEGEAVVAEGSGSGAVSEGSSVVEAKEAGEAVEEKREEEEEAKKEGAEEEKEEEAGEERPKFKFERDYVVPLRRVYWLGRNRRAKRAVRVLREFVLRHTKAERVVIDNEVNEAIWARSIKRPPRRIAVHVGVTEDGKAYVYLWRNSGSSSGNSSSG